MLKVVQTLDDAMEFKRWMGERGCETVALDTETTGVNSFDPKFKVRIIQFGSNEAAWVIELDRWLGLVDEICTGFKGRWYIHNSRFDIAALAVHGVKLNWAQTDDTMIAMRLAEPTLPAGLKSAATRHVSAAAAGGQLDLHRAMKANKWDWDTVPIDFPPYVFYAALDTVITHRLAETEACQRGFNSPVYSLEMQVRHVCSNMENNGMRVDLDFSRQMSDALREEADQLQNDMKLKYGFSVTSTSDLGKWLMSNGAPITKTTAGGSPSVDKESLDSIAERRDLSPQVAEVVTAALRVRKIIKIASSYFDNFLKLADHDSVLHPSIETVAARTGRMSIREPALQTLPRVSDDPDSKIVRKAVIPRAENEVLVSSDYEQIELRVIASLSEDPGLIEAFKTADHTGLDFFTASARQVYGDPGIQKSDSRRPPIKTLFYASAYGAGVPKMAISASTSERIVTVEEMQEIKDRVFSAYPGMGRFVKDSENICRANDGWVSTEAGRQLWVDPKMAYKAANARIQGTAADVLKIALVNLAQAGLDHAMVVPVHDELLFSIPEDQLEDAKDVIRSSMADYTFPVPLLAEPSAGYKTWGDVPK